MSTTNVDIEEFKDLPYKRCLILNPFNRTILAANIPHTLQNWYAIMGTDVVEQFKIDDLGNSILYSDSVDLPPHGIQFKDWTYPVFGILIIVGPSDDDGNVMDLDLKTIAKVVHDFKYAAFFKR